MFGENTFCSQLQMDTVYNKQGQKELNLNIIIFIYKIIMNTSNIYMFGENTFCSQMQMDTVYNKQGQREMYLNINIFMYKIIMNTSNIYVFGENTFSCYMQMWIMYKKQGYRGLYLLKAYGELFLQFSCVNTTQVYSCLSRRQFKLT